MVLLHFALASRKQRGLTPKQFAPLFHRLGDRFSESVADAVDFPKLAKPFDALDADLFALRLGSRIRYTICCKALQNIT